jgi:hypothetical protein
LWTILVESRWCPHAADRKPVKKSKENDFSY